MLHITLYSIFEKFYHIISIWQGYYVFENFSKVNSNNHWKESKMSSTVWIHDTPRRFRFCTKHHAYRYISKRSSRIGPSSRIYLKTNKFQYSRLPPQEPSIFEVFKNHCRVLESVNNIKTKKTHWWAEA